MVRRKLAADNPGSAQAQRDVSISFEKLGGLALQAGDLVEARARFEDSLVIARKLAKANPNSADAQRDLSISVENLGDVAVRADDLMAARPRYEEDLAIRRKLAETNHNSAQAQRDLLLALVKLGWVKRDHALVNEALTIARGLARAGHLAPPDHGLVDWVIGIRDSLP
jgi:tetratricopeptide (TPR) repeat protein